MGAWVLREACSQVRAWQQTHHVCAALGVAVNVSVQQLEHAAFPDFVARVCRETGLEPARLTLEVTESAVMKNDEGARAAFARLKSRVVPH
ncbi:hypothetical protein BH24DEI2_BH24DEI2_27600 [soil metagenome]